MQWIDLTFPDPESNLAFDEALWDLSETRAGGDFLRLWEPRRYFVVAGYGNKIRGEVDIDACRRHGIPILRRISGGGTVLQGPGCLNYTLVLDRARHEALSSIRRTNAYILSQHQRALQALLGSGVEFQGETDLALGNLKFSGNAQRRGRRSIVFHGTFLLDFDLGLIDEILPIPHRQPPYRKNRSHIEFLTNIGPRALEIKRNLRGVWKAAETLSNIPREKTAQLVREKYSQASWNARL